MDDSGGLEGEGGRLSEMWSGMPRDKILVATHPILSRGIPLHISERLGASGREGQNFGGVDGGSLP